jgi:hypothetical protein
MMQSLLESVGHRLRERGNDEERIARGGRESCKPLRDELREAVRHGQHLAGSELLARAASARPSSSAKSGLPPDAA